MAGIQAPEVTRDDGATATTRPPGWGSRLRSPSLVGIVVGLAFFSVSLTPSLVPRPAFFLGLLSGLWACVGYFLGAAMERWVRQPPDAIHPRRIRHASLQRIVRVRSILPGVRPILRRLALPVAASLYAMVYGGLVISWQNDVRSLLDMEPLESTSVLVFAGTTVLGVLVGGLIGMGLGVVRRVSRAAFVGRGRALAGPASLLATLLTAVVVTSLLLFGAMKVVETIYADLNTQTADGFMRPVSSERSAGPGSPVVWDGLGRHGRAFIGGGPNAERIEEVTGTVALDPVRVYVGMGNADTLEDRARVAVEELRRTGGFERSVLVVATPTGSGWLEAQAVDSVEYLYGGDTAIVAIQYSYLPSWASFLFDTELPIDASKALFDAVHSEWTSMPADERPTLAVYGLSLGAMGMQGALGDVTDIQDRTDAALFVGPPNNSQPWRDLQAGRDAGSPVWQPVLDDGAEVRWMSKPGDFQRLDGDWQQPRIAYLQHATDAVTWMDTDVIWRRPVWLSGPAADGGRGEDVSDAMVWFPGVTYLHLVADMIMGVAVPAGHGHNFGDVILDGWAGVLPDHGLDLAAQSRIQAVLESYSRDIEDPIWE